MNSLRQEETTEDKEIGCEEEGPRPDPGTPPSLLPPRTPSGAGDTERAEKKAQLPPSLPPEPKMTAAVAMTEASKQHGTQVPRSSHPSEATMGDRHKTQPHTSA